MENYLIISATNRPDNRTYFFAKACKKILEERKLKVDIYGLEDLPTSFILSSIYDGENGPLQSIVDKFIKPAQKIVFILPEYNGSYPGVLKLFIDAIPPYHFKGKKALLIGTSSGRAGNLRGMDHLAAVLQYIRVEVYSQKLPISSIENLVDEEGNVIDSGTISQISSHIDEFIAF